jgi:trimeric autotransporter adhesin
MVSGPLPFQFLAVPPKRGFILNLQRFLLTSVCALFLVTSASASTRRWSGNVDGSQWSTPGNWDTGAPVSGDSLIFPVGVSFLARVTHNDIPGLALTSVYVQSYYGFDGLPVTLSGGLFTDDFSGWAIPTTLVASQILNSGNGILQLPSTIDLNSFALTVQPSDIELKGSIIGTGSVNLAGGIVGGFIHVTPTGSSTFSGTFTVTGRLLKVDGSISNSNLTIVGGGILTGSGTVPDTSVNNGRITATDLGVTGLLTTHNLFFSGSNSYLWVDIASPVPASGYDQIRTIGTVTLTNPSLEIHFQSTNPTPGQSFTVIDNDGLDPVVGTFNALPEGAIVSEGSVRFRITYAGGTGNDVVLTAVAATTTTLTPAPNPSDNGQPVVLTAHVTSGSGTPTGTVSFEEGAAVLGTAPLDGSGNASITIHPAVGSHSIVARYLGDAVSAPSSAPAVVVVNAIIVPTLGSLALILVGIALAVIGARFLAS